MKTVLPVLALLISGLHADLVITEVMPKSGSPSINSDGDWWELTNTGLAAVVLNDYTWDDTPSVAPDPPSISTFPDFTINPGESIIILQEDTDNINTWRAAWNIDASVRVLARDQFSIGVPGGEAFSGLSRDGDEVNVYDADGDRVANIEFGTAITGRSMAFHRDEAPIYGLHSTVGEHGAVASLQAPSDTGSPGDAGIHFLTAPVAYGDADYSYSVQAVKPGAAAPTLTAISLPSFLTFSPGTGGTATITNNRALTLADAGSYLVRIGASSSGTSTTQEYLLTIFNPAPSVILNEYNAVEAANFLNGGTLSADEDGAPASSDSHFGRVQGNGGPWVEFVVVGDGSPGEVDLRGWSVEIGEDLGSGFVKFNTLVFTNHADWQSVPTGTILTLTAKNTAQGGLDSGFALRDNRATTGDTWSNVWIGDPDYFVYTSAGVNGYTLAAGVVGGIEIDNGGTQIRIKNTSSQIVFGPAGEGVDPRSGVSSTEVFMLKDQPTPLITPITGRTGVTLGYDDESDSSTFGSPNLWMEGGVSAPQLFTPYVVDFYLEWTAANSLTGNDALRTADPDADGRSNIEEYAFGGDPNVKDSAYPAGPLTFGAQVGWTVVLRSNDGSLDFSYEASENLSSWSPITPVSTVVTPFPGNPDFSQVTLEFDLGSTVPAEWFLRTMAQ